VPARRNGSSVGRGETGAHRAGELADAMQRDAAVYTVGDFIRRVVESLFRADFRGRLLCSRCLIKLTKDNLDKSYAKRDVIQVIEELFTAPGTVLRVATAPCGLCARKKVACLGMPAEGR
jgi:hypothetical protein